MANPIRQEFGLSSLCPAPHRLMTKTHSERISFVSDPISLKIQLPYKFEVILQVSAGISMERHQWFTTSSMSRNHETFVQSDPADGGNPVNTSAPPFLTSICGYLSLR